MVSYVLEFTVKQCDVLLYKLSRSHRLKSAQELKLALKISIGRPQLEILIDVLDVNVFYDYHLKNHMSSSID